MSSQTKTVRPEIVLKASKPKPTDEIGAPGLKEFSGFLQEESVVELRGQQGALRYREMADNCPCVDAALSVMKNTAMRAIQDGRVEPYSGPSRPHVVSHNKNDWEWTNHGKCSICEGRLQAQLAKVDADSYVDSDEQRAEVVEQCFEDMAHSRSDMDSEALTLLEYGYAPLEMVAKRREGFRLDPDRSSRFADGLVGFSKVSLRAQESVSNWEFDEAGRRLTGLTQLPAPLYRQYTIPIERIALFRTRAVKGNPEGRSLLRSAWFAWKFFKRGTAIAWIGAERDVTGIPVLKGPHELFATKPTADQTTGYNRLKQIGENVRNDEQACVLLPSDVDPETKVPLYDFSLVSSPGAKVLDVPAMVKDQERQILMVLFSDFLLLGHEKIGTQALFGGRMGLYALQLDALLDRYDETLNRQMIPRLALLNGWPMDRLPQFRHGKVTEADLDLLGKYLQSYATAGGVLDPELDAYLREQAGWPAPSVDDIGIVAPPKAPPVAEPEEHVDDVPEGETGPDETPGVDEGEAVPEVAKSKAQPRQRQGRYAPGTGDVLNALNLLRDRQRIGGGDSIAHGLEVASEYPCSASRDYGDQIEAAPVEDVPIAGLKATHPSVRRERVREFVENPRACPAGKRSLSGVLEDVPVVFEADGQRYIHDGHHRIAAAKLLGQKTVRARVIRPGADSLGKAFSPSQPRDDDGKWSTGGGGGSSSGGAAASGGAPDSSGEVSDPAAWSAYHDGPAPSPAEHATLAKYQSDEGYAPINRALRKELMLAPKGKETVANMDSYFDRASALRESTVTFRGMSTMPEGMKAGRVFADKAYVSTTLDKKVASEFAGKSGVLMRITVPKGTRVVSMDHALGSASKFSEAEVLLRRRARFRVTNVSRANGRTVVDAVYM